jgi:hypothetical protein
MAFNGGSFMFRITPIKAVGALSLCLATISLTSLCHAQGSSYGGGGSSGAGGGATGGGGTAPPAGYRQVKVRILSPGIGPAPTYDLTAIGYVETFYEPYYSYTAEGFHVGASGEVKFDYSNGTPNGDIMVLCESFVMRGTKILKRSVFPELPYVMRQVRLNAEGKWSRTLSVSGNDFAPVAEVSVYMVIGSFAQADAEFLNETDTTTEYYYPSFVPNPPPPTDHNHRRVRVLRQTFI